LNTEDKRNSGKIDHLIDWNPIETFDHSRDTGEVYVKGPYYERPVKVSCNWVKLCKYASHWGEVPKE
jgi:hypothetical protein